MLLYLLLFLAAGIVVGCLFPKDKLKSLSGKLMQGTVFLLVFSMGLGLGLREDLPEQIVSMGSQALIIALFAVLGSVGVAVLLTAIGRRRKS